MYDWCNIYFLDFCFVVGNREKPDVVGVLPFPSDTNMKVASIVQNIRPDAKSNLNVVRGIPATRALFSLPASTAEQTFSERASSSTAPAQTEVGKSLRDFINKIGKKK